MATIIPRWEWRTFGTHFGIADGRFAKLTPTDIQESDELYFLGGAGENAKIRDELVDIKVLREVDAEGLERWEPVMKKGFPLPAADVVKLFTLLHLPPPALAGDAYTLDQLLEKLVLPTGALRAVKVHKRRVRYTVGGCTSEVTDLSADGKGTRTIAIESEMASAVVAAVESVGLGGYINTSYPRGLRSLLEDAPERYAVIDAGTNSVKFHIGERGPGDKWRTIADRSELTQLGEGLEGRGEIGPEAIERTTTA